MGAAGIGMLAGYLSNYGIAMGAAPYEFSLSLEGLGAFGNALGAVAGAMAIASILAGEFGMDYDDALAVTLGVVGAIIIIAGIQNIAATLSWLGPIGFIIAILVWLYSEIVGVGDTKEKIVSFKCYPWQAPTGGDDCSKCGDFSDCSQYKCQSLGQGCEFINKGTEHQRCVDMTPRYDASSPIISPFYDIITEGFEYSKVQSNGFELKETGKSCIPEFTTVLFGVETDRPAQCKIGTDPLETYDEMIEYFGGSNLYLENHTNILVIPSIESLKNEFNLTPVQVNKLGEFNFYVKCKGVNGKANDAAYVIKSCVREGPDLTAPMITKVDPEKGYVGFNATELKATFWTNEPSNCKYSSFDLKYSEMENQMVCQNSLNNQDFYGFPCNTTFSVADNERFFVRCRDLSENQNTMTESYVYELIRSESNLRIVLTDPEDGEIIRAASEPATVNLEVLTAGGAEDGKAICSYKFRESAQYVKFFDTSSNKHLQVFNSVMGGEYGVWIECEDVADNIARTVINFTLYVDTDAPGIARVYYENGLKIITNEDTTCAYSFVDSRCSFDIEESEDVFLMPGTGKKHTADWQTENTYYIKCMDQYNNRPGRCSIVVRPYDIL
jgi:hypothetical protein